MKAKRRVVTSPGGERPGLAKRRPTVRRLKPAIAPVVRRALEAGSNGRSAAPIAPARATAAGPPPVQPIGPEVEVDLSVDLGRGLVLENPILVASGTFGYGTEYSDVVATDDGSVGHHGFVTELIPEYEAWADQAFACGPLPMLRALAGLAASRRRRLGVANLGRKRGGGKPIPAGSPQARRKAFLQVSMEQNMGCAVGACLGCVVLSTSGAPQRVCREGPVFASDELDWEGGW